MTYTEQDVERADEAYQRAFDAADRTGPAEGRFQRSHLAGLRAALEAMAREPLEDVLRAQHVYNIEIEPAGPNYYAEVVSAAHDRRTGTGATIADAIRNAVAVAKGDE